MGAPKLDQSNPLLDKRFVNAFVEGVMKTLTMMANCEVTLGKPHVQPQFEPKGDVAGLVGMICGPLKGTMSISFSKKAILYVVEQMLGEKHSEINPAVTDAVGELTNQVYGSAKTTLNQMGYAFDMAIPSVITGSFTISKHHNGATLVIPFTLADGSAVNIDITIVTG